MTRASDGRSSVYTPSSISYECVWVDTVTDIGRLRGAVTELPQA
jgi:hypothetical protein